MNALKSLGGKKHDDDHKSVPKHRFALSSLRGLQQPEISKKLYKLIKSENHVIGAYESAGRESQGVASQLSEWGEGIDDDSMSDISDKLAVLLSEIAEQEDVFSQNLEESRGMLKVIRNTESNVQPTRNHKAKILDEIEKLKAKEPTSTKLQNLEQELVRAEAANLVAEAQLTNVTRQKFKDAYDLHTAAVIERAEKQILLAKYARELLGLLDDTPIVPGEDRVPYTQQVAAQEILTNAETSLKDWTSTAPAIASSSNKLGSNAMGSSIEAPVHNQARVDALAQANVQRALYPTETTPAVPTSEVTQNAALAS